MFIRTGGIGRNEEFNVVETDAFEPAIGMPIDYRRAGAVGDHVLDDHVADLAGGGFVGLWSAAAACYPLFAAFRTEARNVPFCFSGFSRLRS